MPKFIKVITTQGRELHINIDSLNLIEQIGNQYQLVVGESLKFGVKGGSDAAELEKYLMSATDWKKKHASNTVVHRTGPGDRLRTTRKSPPDDGGSDSDPERNDGESRVPGDQTTPV